MLAFTVMMWTLAVVLSCGSVICIVVMFAFIYDLVMERVSK